ncbi:MAG: tetratricopeptide repeat protein [Candidatus Eremiobacteraeota bacterium]|nr:tetratricopeptide repeat protein [Candidatus Eremiobacteraeota bacterium]
MEHDLYRILGITGGATPEEIKYAYYASVRKHPPEKDPDGFKKIRHAYEILSNAQARSNYDSMERFGTEILQSFEEAVRCLDEGNYQAACSRYRHILILAPELDQARDMLAYCHFQMKEYEKAVQQLDMLVMGEKPLPFYLHNAARVRHHWAYDLLDDKEKPENLLLADKLFEEALGFYRRAAESEPLNSEFFLGMAEILLAKKDYDTAVALAERAAAVTGKPDFQDFDALFFLCIIHLSRNNLEQVNRTVARIEGLVSDETELRSYVAWKFGRLAIDLASAYGFSAALEVARASVRFDPGEDAYGALVSHYGDVVDLESEFRQIPEGEDFLKYFFALELQLSTSKEEERPLLESQWRDLMKTLERMDPERLFHYAEKIKTECPTFYRRNRDLIDNVIDITKALYPVIQEAQKASRDSSIPRILRYICALSHDMILDVDGKYTGEHEVNMKHSIEIVARESPGAIKQGIGLIAKVYPVLYGSQKKLWEYIVTIAGMDRPWWQKIFG